MLELILSTVKGLPLLLQHIVEVVFVAAVVTSLTLFTYGLWVGIRIVGGKRHSIKKISVFPPSIEFYSEEEEQ